MDTQHSLETGAEGNNLFPAEYRGNQGSFGDLVVKLAVCAAEDQPELLLPGPAMLPHLQPSMALLWSKTRQGSAGRMFLAAVPGLWSCSLHPLAVKLSKSGDIPGMLQKPPVQESLERVGCWLPKPGSWCKGVFF